MYTTRAVGCYCAAYAVLGVMKRPRQGLRVAANEMSVRLNRIGRSQANTVNRGIP